ncbi:MAG: class I SAM-dependent methyltransferase [Rivularia sp. (in: cyanobacteria)]
MSFAYQVSGWNRKRKWESFLKEIKPTTESTILDIGFSEEEYSDTDNFLEKHYPRTEQITALCLETPEAYLHARKEVDFKVPKEAIAVKKKLASKRYPQLEIVTYNGKTFPFADKTFDICWSNAVLEHVGDEKEQILFLKEIKRVAKQAFITTPNRYFPIEVHTRIPLLHFLPKKVFDSFLHFVGKEWAADEYMYLLSLSDLCKRLEAAGITKYKIIKNRLLFFTLDFVVVINDD